jgi:hypothetical protein
MAGQVMMTRLNSMKATLVRYLSNGASTSQGVSAQETLRRMSRHWLPLLGWPGIVAIGLSVMCIPLYFSTIVPMQARVNQLQRADNAMSAKSAVADNGYHGASNPVDELEEFYRHFPPEKNSPRWLGKMAEIATRNGLNLNHGEYIVTQDKVGRLVRFKITLPVQARYTQIRKFLSALNSEIPNMALENVQFQRKDVLDSDVQVKIRLQLYMVQES